MSKSASRGKRVPLNMRTTVEIRTKSEESATLAGRSLVQEVDYRIERSFEMDRIAMLEVKIDSLISLVGIDAERLVEYFHAARTEAIQSMPRRKPIIRIQPSAEVIPLKRKEAFLSSIDMVL